jgi:hypothetical protein
MSRQSKKIIVNNSSLVNISETFNSTSIKIKGTNILGTERDSLKLISNLSDVFLENKLDVYYTSGIDHKIDIHIINTIQKSASELIRFNIKTFEDFKPLYTILSMKQAELVHHDPQQFVKSFIRTASCELSDNSREIIYIDKTNQIVSVVLDEIFAIKVFLYDQRLMVCSDNKIGFFSLSIDSIRDLVPLFLDLVGIKTYRNENGVIGI